VKKIIGFAVVMCMFCTSLCADIVYLEDGSIIEGVFVNDSSKGMSFQIEKDGVKEIVTIPYEQIMSVDFNTSSVESKKKHAERLKKEKREKEKVAPSLADLLGGFNKPENESSGTSSKKSAKKKQRESQEADVEEVVREAKSLLELLGYKVPEE